MPQDLVVFIDEAGDEGFNIVAPPAKKASEWFLVGAAVCRYDSLHIVNAAAPDSFHFRKEHHHRRVSFAEKIAGLPLTAMVVLAHKPSIDVEAALRNTTFSTTAQSCCWSACLGTAKPTVQTARE